MSKSTEAPPQEQSKPSPKQVVGEAAERWLARNRSLVLRQTPVWAQSLAAIVVGLGTIAVVGAVFFRIDEVVTVTGQLEAITGTTEVKTPAGGKVAAVLFKDGQTVRKGELLVRFDTRQAADEKATLTRLIDLENRDLQSKLNILRERQEVLEQKVKTSEEITSELKGLVSNGGFQRVQYLQQLDQLYELKSQLSSVQLEMNRTSLETQKSIGQMRNRLRQAELQLQYQTVLAPVSGVVFDPKARVDGVLQAGETILTLVPQQGLKAQVFVPNKDIGFVKTGLNAKVRVDAFPFTRYGELEGRVSQIGADALPPDPTANFYRFPVKLTLNRSYLESKGVRIPLRTGMAITANLKLREKRVISLISDMLVDQTESIKSIRQQ
jgi:hemolysin D